jgi:hypothetical protein
MSDPTGSRWQRASYFREQLTGTLVEADDGSKRIIGFFVEIQNLFPIRQTKAALLRGGMTHCFFRCGLSSFF